MAWPVNVRWGFWAGVLMFAVIVSSLFWGSWRLLDLLEDENQTPVEAMVLQGELQYTSANDVREALLSGEIGSFFTADVDVLRARVEALPWVYSVSVRKEWPARLRIYIVEQEAAALWFTKGEVSEIKTTEEKGSAAENAVDGIANTQGRTRQLLNVQGDIFTAPVSGLEQELPELHGPEHAVDEVVHQYRRLSQLLALDGFYVTRLELSERFAVRLWLDNDIELRLGREARLERIQRFIELYPVIKRESEKQIAYVDLRYDTGVAVGWNEQNEVSEP